MGLINTSSLDLEEFMGSSIPPYAILPHTWDADDVSLQEFESPTAATRAKKGYAKITKTCSLARSNDINYAWVDTCCIDKSSSADLTEAVNSMFQYSNVIPTFEELCPCRWFTRGWTLQELIAPEKVYFIDQNWNYRGSKHDIGASISSITAILASVLHDSAEMSKYTTRVEYTAYCLMGIFDVNMPLLYGEGAKAFIWLQHEIMRTSSDISILGWNSGGSHIWAP
ncbi:hypothetical protein B0T26DRAFT_740840 [Lasiosphaeria miniovina]|uniref:Heterokaryon incompatibility domain-containing protein n=1 Tax=Lasiosphaeria miniovina TaxID=1954250 RepID=A0AA40DVS2_9PEZI|nr:uncharacterized protein B0T26DRAFT_740840 [Lasiosphaeria miniovina]KAK0717440.1 hypothetical protein B0T26DRAFT_740840 [Lasiosphaeria miniovina]